MKRILLPLIAALALPIAVSAEISNKVHNRCKDAKDYLGCVKAMTTNSSDIPSIRMIDGGVELSGNSCPTNYAYVGGGTCREVVKDTWYTPTFIGLLSAGWENTPALLGDFSLKLGESTKAVIDKSCPLKEPYLYTNSSCEPKPVPVDRKIIRKYTRGITKKQREAFDKGLFRIFGIEGLAY